MGHCHANVFLSHLLSLCLRPTPLPCSHFSWRCRSDTRESLKYKLSGGKGGLDTWGFEYVKNLSGEIGKEWEERKKGQKDITDLKALVDEIVPFNVKHGSEPEACDLLMEVDLLPQVSSPTGLCVQWSQKLAISTHSRP